MEWISVTSNVPTDGTFVLVSIDHMYIDIALYRLGKFFINTKRVYPDAWMALPKPYRIGKHEKGYYDRMKRMEKFIEYGAIKC